MTIKRISIVSVAIAAGIVAGSAQAQNTDLFFTGSGQATLESFTAPGGPTLTTTTETAFSATDPNTGQTALTFAFPGIVGIGITDILSPSSTLVGAISFYDIGDNAFMAEYANTGGQLDQTINSGFVPSPGNNSITEQANGDFIFESGGALRVNNDYFGNISGTTEVGPGVPDGGSTLGLLGGALTVLGAASRRLRK